MFEFSPLRRRYGVLCGSTMSETDEPCNRRRSNFSPRLWPVCTNRAEPSSPSSPVRVPPLLRRNLRFDVDVLGLLECLEPLAAELAAEARLLEAAEGPRVVVGERVVEPNGSRLDLAHAAHDVSEVPRVD